MTAAPAPLVHLDATEIARLMPMILLIDALDRAFRDPPIAPMRMNVAGGGGRELLVMPVVGARFAGSKLLTVMPHNAARGLPVINGIFCLFDFETVVPLATFDAGESTGRRTAAASAVAARHLARADARLVVTVIP